MGTKKKIRFNLLDVFIILILVAAVGVFSYFAMGKWEANNNSTGEKISYTMEFKGINEKYVEALKQGGNVSEVRKGGSLGKIVSVESGENIVVSENKADGTFVESAVPDEYTAHVVIESEYTQTDSGIKINDLDVKVGKKVAIRTENIAIEGTILAIEN